jgi:peptide/nickel transport system permease protein
MLFLKKLRSAPVHIKLSFLMVLVFIGTAVFADFISPYNPNATELLKNNLPPIFMGGEATHPLGTDQLGRDLLSRCIHGLRVSAGMAFFGLLAGTFLGVMLGLLSGYFGKWVDSLIMLLVDFQFAVPYTLLILMGLVVFGNSIPILMLFIGLAKWETYARVTRGVVLSVREYSYVEAAYSVGARSSRIILRHILPNIVPIIVVLMTLNFPAVLMLETSLSFLGIGVQPPTATLGRMVGDGKNYLMTVWWLAIIPAFIILLLSLLIQTLGDWMRDAMDVRLNGK